MLRQDLKMLRHKKTFVRGKGVAMPRNGLGYAAEQPGVCGRKGCACKKVRESYRGFSGGLL